MTKLLSHINFHPKQDIAIVDENRKVNYAELFNEIYNLKTKLTNIFQNKKIRVLLSGNNNTDFVILLLSLYDLNVELILIDPKSSTQEIEDLKTTTNPNYIIYEANLFNNHYHINDKIVATNYTYHLSELSKENIIERQTKLHFCSSGSTGNPKVFGFTDVQITEQFLNIANYLSFSSNDKSLCTLTITHSHGLMISIPMLMNGACVYYLSPENCKPENIINYIHQNKITIYTAVPFQHNLMLQTDSEIKNPMQTLRYCFCGSAPMSSYLTNSFYKKFGIRLNQVYGLSEIGPICFNLDVNLNNYTSVGKVIPLIEYKIIDENANEIKLEQEGELIVRASFMCEEYFNNEVETKSTFINGWLHTKDIVRIDEHKNIFIVGRKSNFINVAGYKIYPIEIEKVLMSMEGIKEAVVFGIENDAKGQLIKAIVTRFCDIDEESILAFCKLHLPKYKVPHIIQIEKELQQTSINKVELKAYHK